MVIRWPTVELIGDSVPCAGVPASVLAPLVPVSRLEPRPAARASAAVRQFPKGHHLLTEDYLPIVYQRLPVPVGEYIKESG